MTSSQFVGTFEQHNSSLIDNSILFTRNAPQTRVDFTSKPVFGNTVNFKTAINIENKTKILSLIDKYV